LGPGRRVAEALLVTARDQQVVEAGGPGPVADLAQVGGRGEDRADVGVGADGRDPVLVVAVPAGQRRRHGDHAGVEAAEERRDEVEPVGVQQQHT
jgi:hypothetical protein